MLPVRIPVGLRFRGAADIAFIRGYRTGDEKKNYVQKEGMVENRVGVTNLFSHCVFLIFVVIAHKRLPTILFCFFLVDMHVCIVKRCKFLTCTKKSDSVEQTLFQRFLMFMQAILYRFDIYSARQPQKVFGLFCFVFIFSLPACTILEVRFGDVCILDGPRADLVQLLYLIKCSSRPSNVRTLRLLNFRRSLDKSLRQSSSC